MGRKRRQVRERYCRQDAEDVRGRIFLFVWRYIHDYGHSPTQREIAAAVGRSQAAVSAHVENMRRRGFLLADYGIGRSVRPALPVPQRTPPPKPIQLTLFDMSALSA